MGELEEMERARLENIRSVKAEFAVYAEVESQRQLLLTRERHVIMVLIDARQRAGLTQSELAKRVGCTRETIARIENNKTTPTLQLTILIANTLGLGISLLKKQSDNIVTKAEKLY